jgi:hypothetical protein
MKVLVAQDVPTGRISFEKYNYCNAGEILIFTQELFNIAIPSEISMMGITTRQFTTFVTVKDIRISRQFYKELIELCIEDVLETDIDLLGHYTVKTKKGIVIPYNINDIVEELLSKAETYPVGANLVCSGRELFENYSSI